MSLFSETLSKYIDRSGVTLKLLAQTSGYDPTLLTKIRKGDRPARIKVKLDRLISALSLTPSEEAQLVKLWTIDQIGMDTYNSHIAVKELIESFNRHIEITPPSAVSAAPEKSTYKGKENVRYMLHRMLGGGIEDSGERIYIMAQPDDSMFSELLLAVCSAAVPITHIISMFPGSAGKQHQIENLAYIRNLMPCIMSNPDYEINYYYDSLDISENHYLLMPNLFITGDSAVLVSKNWDNAVISREPEIVSFYRSRFDRQLRVTQPFNQPIPTLFHEVQHLVPMADAGIQKNPDECFYAIARQPCITPYFEPEDAEYVSDEYENKQALIDMFLNQYQPFLKKSNLVQFFCLSGVYDFLRDGVIWELGDCIIPLPIQLRIKLLKGLCEAETAGKHRFCLIREDELKLMPDAAMALYQSNYFTVHIRNEEDHICSVNEGETASDLRSFFNYLPDSGLVYSEEESLRMLLEVLDEAAEGQSKVES